MKLGIIGSGTIVQEFLPELVKLEGVEIVAIQGVKDRMEQVWNLCRLYGFPNAVSDFDELCKTGIDTVYIAVPNDLHFSYCRKALEKGLNVIVEKPIASNWYEAKLLQQKADENKVFLFEAITTLYLPNYLKIKEWLPRIGTIKIIESHYSQYSRRYDAFCKGVVLPAFDPAKAGGALMDLNLYNLHFVMVLFGLPEEYKYYANIEKNIDTSGTLVLKYPSFLAVCTAAKDCKGLSGSVIQGTNGFIRTTYPPNLIGQVLLELNDGTIETFDDGSASLRLIPEFKAFIKAIEENDDQFCYQQLRKSLDVSEIQTKSRREAGIDFPADFLRWE